MPGRASTGRRPGGRPRGPGPRARPARPGPADWTARMRQERSWFAPSLRASRVCGLNASVRPPQRSRVPTLNQRRPRRSPPGGDDAVLVDLAVDRRARHAERLGRLDLVALVVLQAL